MKLVTWRSLAIPVVVILVLTAFTAIVRNARATNVSAVASLNLQGTLKVKTVFVGEIVSFFGSLSAGEPPLQYTWEFRNGQTSHTANPTSAYSQPGTYDVALVVQDATGMMDLDTVRVNVQQPVPGDDFAGTDAGPDQSAQEDGIVVFDGSNSWPSVTDKSKLGFVWDFGDGSPTASGIIVSHSYGNAGPYTVRLKVTDSSTGAFDIDTCLVTVLNVPPVADAGPASRAAYEDDVVTFDAGATTDTPSDLSDMAYAWDFGDGSRGTGAIVTHSYTQVGTYVVRLTVTDDNAASSSDTATVTVQNRAPIAEAGADVTYSEGNPIFFDGRGSSDTSSDEPILSYAWTPDPGVPPLSGWGPSYTWFDDGGPDSAVHEAALEVKDDNGATSTDTTDATVINVPPRVGITGMWQFQGVLLFEGKAFDPGTDDLIFSWIDDGHIWYRSTSFARGQHPREVVQYALYPTGVDFNQLLPLTFSLFVMDDEGGVGMDTITIVAAVATPPPLPLCVAVPDMPPGCLRTPRDFQFVDDLAPRFDAGSDKQAMEDFPMIFVPAWFEDLGSTKWTMVWEFGDGAVTQLMDVTDPAHTYVSHAYQRAGTYTVTLTILDSVGEPVGLGLPSDGLMVVVQNTPPVANFEIPSEAQEDQTVYLDGTPSQDAPSDRAKLLYAWRMSDGATLADASGTHAFTKNGAASVQLTVVDDNGVSSQKLTTLNVVNVAPVAMGTAAPATEGGVIVLDGSLSSDGPSDRPLMGFTWKKNGIVVASGWNPVFSAPSTGTVSYVLEVSDDDGATSSYTVDVPIQGRSPDVYAGPDLTVYGTALDVPIEGYAFDVGGHTLQATWTFSDGGVAYGFAVTHSFTATDTYTACLSVSDGTAAGESCATIEVQLDTDGDNLLDEAEQVLGTDPTKFDTDGDGLTDFYEFSISHTNPAASDSDSDGLNDWEELFPGKDTYVTDPWNPDSDYDGAGDGQEIYTKTYLMSKRVKINGRGTYKTDLTNVAVSGTSPMTQVLLTVGISGDDVGDYAYNIMNVETGITRSLRAYDTNLGAKNNVSSFDLISPGYYLANDFRTPHTWRLILTSDSRTHKGYIESFQIGITVRTNPNNPDCDGDRLLDGGSRIIPLSDTVNITHLDAHYMYYTVNEDGSRTYWGEATFGTDPWSTDTDKDTLSDRAEIFGLGIPKSDPLKLDTDQDGANDNVDLDPVNNLMIKVTLERIHHGKDPWWAPTLQGVVYANGRLYLSERRVATEDWEDHGILGSFPTTSVFYDVYHIDVPDDVEVVQVQLQGWSINLRNDDQLTDHTVGVYITSTTPWTGKLWSGGSWLTAKIETYRPQRVNTIAVYNENAAVDVGGIVHYLPGNRYFVMQIKASDPMGPFIVGFNTVVAPWELYLNSYLYGRLQNDSREPFNDQTSFYGDDPDQAQISYFVPGMIAGELSGTNAQQVLSWLLQNFTGDEVYKVVTPGNNVLLMGLPMDVLKLVPYRGYLDSPQGPRPESNFFKKVWEGIVAFFAGVANAIVGALTAFVSFLVDLVTAVVEWGIKMLTALVEAAIAAVKAVVEAVLSVLKAIIDAVIWIISTAIQVMFEPIRVAIENWILGIAAALNHAGEAYAEANAGGPPFDVQFHAQQLFGATFGSFYDVVKILSIVLAIVMIVVSPFMFVISIIVGLLANVIIGAFFSPGEAPSGSQESPDGVDPSASLSGLASFWESKVQSEGGQQIMSGSPEEPTGETENIIALGLIFMDVTCIFLAAIMWGSLNTELPLGEQLAWLMGAVGFGLDVLALFLSAGALFCQTLAPDLVEPVKAWGFWISLVGVVLSIIGLASDGPMIPISLIGIILGVISMVIGLYY